MVLFKRILFTFLAAFFLSTSAIVPVLADDVYEFKISVDTVMNHPRNQGLVLFMEKIKEKSNNRLSPKLFHSAQLYKDKNVPKALALGTLDMGVPGLWQLSTYDANADISSLPMFYGLPPEKTVALIDGKLGTAISKSLEKKMRVKVLGRFFEIGYLEMFMVTKPIEKMTDFNGTKIRYPGSPVLALRIKSLGGSPMAIAFADVPMALIQGTVDGLITSFKTADGVKLDESGIKYAVKDRGSLLHYVPMVSNKFWKSLPKDLQSIIENGWDETVDEQRALAVKMQKEAQKNMVKRGLKVYEPSDKQLARWRAHMLLEQDAFVKKVKMDPALVDLAANELGL